MKETVIAIHQPNYIPWLGYFYKIYQSDIFVFLDDVQFSNEGMQNYHYIKTPQGSFRLKIPVESKFGNTVNEIRTKDELNWKKKHLRTIEMNYKKAPFFEEIYTDYSNLLENSYSNLAVLDSNIIIFWCKKLGIERQFINSSQLGISTNREEKVLDICSVLKGDIYYSGTGAKAYQIPENFENRGIELRYSIFKPFEYPQLWGDFQSNVTIIDYLMNCGYDWNRVLLNQ